MTVAALAQTHTRRKRTVLLAVLAAGLVVVGGLSTAQNIQDGIAVNVANVLGATQEKIDISVDGTNVTLRSDGVITADQRNAVAGVQNLRSLTVEDGS